MAKRRFFAECMQILIINFILTAENTCKLMVYKYKVHVKLIAGITVLLAFSVFMLAVAENLPETSEFVPLISKLIMRTFGLVCRPSVRA